MAEQQFQVRETIPNLPGELVCAGCFAPMAENPDAGDSPAGAMIMKHDDGCPEVRRLAAGG